jgi:hypothetical protein
MSLATPPKKFLGERVKDGDVRGEDARETMAGQSEEEGGAEKRGGRSRAKRTTGQTRGKAKRTTKRSTR